MFLQRFYITLDDLICLIGLQVCDYCDANDEAKKHPPEYAVDGMESWWQSPPLSRGMKYNEVNLTIDLGQVIMFLIAILRYSRIEPKVVPSVLYYKV